MSPRQRKKQTNKKTCHSQTLLIPPPLVCDAKHGPDSCSSESKTTFFAFWISCIGAKTSLLLHLVCVCIHVFLTISVCALTFLPCPVPAAAFSEGLHLTHHDSVSQVQCFAALHLLCIFGSAETTD